MLLRRTPVRVEREKEEARVDGVVTPDSLEKLVSKHDKTIGADGEEEFGGQFGALAIMVFSHAVVYGLYLALEGGTSPLPSIGQETLGEYAARVYEGLSTAAPTTEGFLLYTGFLVGTALLSAVCPGIEISGSTAPTGTRTSDACPTSSCRASSRSPFPL